MNLYEIDIEELSRIVDLFPWFGAARKAMAVRSGRPQDAALYVGERSILFNCPKADVTVAKEKGSPLQKKVVVVGGDYFTQEQYDCVRQESDRKFNNAISGIKGDDEDGAGKDSFADFCTETLAQIYAQQGYTQQAKYIYSQLSLRYPEKNTYFAALIENLKEENIKK